MTVMEHNHALNTAWDFIENTGISIFLTGKAGTGKTTFLKTVVERSRKRSIVVAPTGVAAINAGGVTIHSFFQLPLSPFVPDSKIKNRFDYSREKRRIISSLDLLIIDEISMVRSDLLDAIDSVLRRFRNHFLPFGGVQLLMIGDLQQLTPVVTPEDEHLLQPYYDTPYFFGSKALSQTEYVTIQLEKVYRQQDGVFLDILNHIRENAVNAEDLALLNSRCRPTFIPRPDEGYIRLTTHNRLADQYNENALQNLPTRKYTYRAEIDGTFPEFAYPTSDLLELKIGTQVMFVKNDPSIDHLYYNGRIGKVTYLDSQQIHVRCPGDEKDIVVEPLVWENARYTLNEETREIETDVQGTFKQYPLRLAWAITIHKSQGLTFDHAIIDASLSFAPGQVYVALSRCRTLEGMLLSSPIPARAIINDQRVEDYIQHQDTNARQSISRLPELKEAYYRHLLVELFTFSDLLHLQESVVRLFIEYFSRSYPQLENLQKQTLETFKQQVSNVSYKWIGIIQQSAIDVLHSPTFLERVSRSAAYFAKTLEALFEKPLRLSAEVKTNNKQLLTRMSNLLPELRQAYKSRVQLLQRISTKGFTISHYLREKQLSLLDAMDTPTEKKKRPSKEKAAKAPKEKTPKEKTWVTTMELYRRGLSPQQIADTRSLTIGTVLGHLAKYVESGELSLSDVIDPSHLSAIQKVINLVGKPCTASAVKALCPPEISYQEIRMVLGLK